MQYAHISRNFLLLLPPLFTITLKKTITVLIEQTIFFSRNIKVTNPYNFESYQISNFDSNYNVLSNLTKKDKLDEFQM